MKNLIARAVVATVVAPAMSLFAVPASAQGTGSVFESQGITPGQAPSSANSRPAGNSDALQLLLDQNQQLQAELQALRGMVEEQGFEIRKLQRDSLSRYTNMDERLRSLESAAASGTSTAAATGNTPLSGTGSAASNNTASGRPGAASTTPVTGTSGNAPASNGIAASSSNRTTAPVANSGSLRNNRTTTGTSASGRGTLQPAVLSEQQLYQMAYDSVINSNFEMSIAEFDQYLSIYPDGRFVTNAHYWKGQAYLFLNRYLEAVDSYEIILNEYPDSAKLPDAMYGLAQAYQGLGNIPQARRLLNEIKRQFPNTGAASLADTRLLSLD